MAELSFWPKSFTDTNIYYTVDRLSIEIISKIAMVSKGSPPKSIHAASHRYQKCIHGPPTRQLVSYFTNLQSRIYVRALPSKLNKLRMSWRL